MIKRLEQLTALVVAAGLALVSYWLFFSWAQGGGVHRRQKPNSSPARQQSLKAPTSLDSKASAGFQQPLLGSTVVHIGEVSFHVLQGNGEPLSIANLHNPAEGTAGIL